jgi:hypothetical protein
VIVAQEETKVKTIDGNVEAVPAAEVGTERGTLFIMIGATVISLEVSELTVMELNSEILF